MGCIVISRRLGSPFPGRINGAKWQCRKYEKLLQMRKIILIRAFMYRICLIMKIILVKYKLKYVKFI